MIETSKFPWEEIEKLQLPFFIYDLDRLQDNVVKVKSFFAQSLATEFGGKDEHSKLYFSLKSNPNKKVVEFLSERVEGFDVSSLAEIKYLIKKKVSPQKISLSGPGKTNDCLDLAVKLNLGIIHVDSVEELNYLNSKGYNAGLSIRIWNKDVFSAKLGIPLNNLQEMIKKHKFQLTGLHVYLGRESFSWEKFEETTTLMTDFIESNKNSFVKNPRIFLGPALPGAWSQELSLRKKTKLPITFEVGRGLVSSIGYYGAQVLSRKENDKGQEILIINGGLQHLGSPFFSLKSNLADIKPVVVRESKEIQEDKKEFILTGSLCLSHDILHPRIALPKSIRKDDWIIVNNTGAYGLTAGYPFFIGQDLPCEYILRHNEVKTARHDGFELYHRRF